RSLDLLDLHSFPTRRSSDLSDVRDRSNNTRNQKFLRGYQVSDSNGAVEFLTIYPGWYGGRTVHIHFKIRLFAAGRRTYDFTSQRSEEHTSELQSRSDLVCRL